MRLLIPLIAGMGIALLVSGLPPLHPTRFAHRVEPYLSGLGGRPSALVAAQGGAGPYRARLQRLAMQTLPSGPNAVRERLLAAGRSETVESFRLDQLMWATGGGCCVVSLGLAGRLAGGGRLGPPVVVAALLGAVSGWVFVDRRLALALSRRRERVRQELPVALDLLTLSIMAGEAIPQAFARVGSSLGGEVGREFLFVVGSVRGGVPMVQALRELPARLPGTGVARLTDALCVGIERGAPLADTLRAQADDMRAETRRYLLESGGRREVLMLIPVVFLIMPTIVAFTLLPGLVSLDLLVP